MSVSMRAGAKTKANLISANALDSALDKLERMTGLAQPSLFDRSVEVTRDAGLALLRDVVGGLLVGHGAQKLFGAFQGSGLKRTAGFMESLGLQPGGLWGTAAGLAEFGGGALTALGLLSPLGSIGVVSSMVMATATAHKGKPIWVTAGGAELPIVNATVATALMLTGPGKYSVDNALGIRVPLWLSGAAALAAGAAVGYGVARQPATQAGPAASEPAAEQPREAVQRGEPATAQA